MSLDLTKALVAEGFPAKAAYALFAAFISSMKKFNARR
jgi:hypothetical protein